MWIGCVHPDRLLSYPDVRFLSGCSFPIRMLFSYLDVDFLSGCSFPIWMLISRPRGFAGTWLARSASAPGSLVRVFGRVVWTTGLSDWLQAPVLLRARHARVLNGPRQAGSRVCRQSTPPCMVP